MTKFWVLLFLLSDVVSLINSECSAREPANASAADRVGDDEDGGDGGFYLEVSGAPSFYQPGGLYTVSLRVRDVICQCNSGENGIA